MSINTPVVIGILVAFIAINLIAAKLYHKPQETMETYAVGDRQMPWFFVCFTYMAGWYVGSTYTGWVGNSVDIGLFPQYQMVYSIGSLLFMYLFARPVWSWGKHYNLETPSDFMGVRYNSPAFQKFYSVFMLIVDGAWLIIEIITLAYIINVSTNGAVSMTAGVWISGIVVGLYTTIGGVNATAITSVIQGFSFVVVGSILFIYIAYKAYGGFVPLYEMISLHKPELLYLPKESGLQQMWIVSVITGTLGSYCWPTTFQRLYLSSSPRETKKTLYIAPICAVIVVFLILVPAMGVSFMDDAPADSQIAEFFIANKYSGAVGLGLVGCFAGAAAMGSISATANCISVPFAKDILTMIWKKTPVVKLAKWTTAAVFLFSMIFASVDIPQLNFFALILYDFVCMCIIPLVGGVFWKRGNAIGAWVSMGIGCACALLQNLTDVFASTSMGGTLIGMILSAAAYIVCGFIFGKQSHIDEMFDVLKKYDNDGNYYPNEGMETVK